MEWLRILHFIPVLTTVLSALFALVLWRHWWAKRKATYLLVWFIGIVTYGIGTTTESITAFIGWNETVFRLWFISGALLGGVPLAQGTVYLLFNKKVGHITSALLIITILTAAHFAWHSPILTDKVEQWRLSGVVLEWQWVRRFSPFINTYAVIFLIGGAIYSAVKYSRQPDGSLRYWGNIWIAIGGLLPGIGGAMARYNMVEGLYVGELIGLLCIWHGYRIIRRAFAPSVHSAQQQAVATA